MRLLYVNKHWRFYPCTLITVATPSAALEGLAVLVLVYLVVYPAVRLVRRLRRLPRLAAAVFASRAYLVSLVRLPLRLRPLRLPAGVVAANPVPVLRSPIRALAETKQTVSIIL